MGSFCALAITLGSSGYMLAKVEALDMVLPGKAWSPYGSGTGGSGATGRSSEPGADFENQVAARCGCGESVFDMHTLLLIGSTICVFSAIQRRVSSSTERQRAVHLAEFTRAYRFSA